MATIKCPTCGAPLQFNENNFGNKVRCYQCRCKFILQYDRNIEMLEPPQNPQYQNLGNKSNPTSSFNTDENKTFTPKTINFPRNSAQPSLPKNLVQPSLPKAPKLPSFPNNANGNVFSRNTYQNSDNIDANNNNTPTVEDKFNPNNKIKFNPINENNFGAQVRPQFPQAAPTVLEPINNKNIPSLDLDKPTLSFSKLPPVTNNEVPQDKPSMFNSCAQPKPIARPETFSSSAPTVADDEVPQDKPSLLNPFAQQKPKISNKSFSSTAPTVADEDIEIPASQTTSTFNDINVSMSNLDSFDSDEYDKEYPTSNYNLDNQAPFLAKLGFLTHIGVKCTCDLVILVVSLLVVGFFFFNTIYLWTYRKSISKTYQTIDNIKNKTKTLTECQTGLIKNYNYAIEYSKKNNNSLPSKQKFFQNYRYEKTEPRVMNCPWKYRNYTICFDGEKLDQFTKKSQNFFTCPYHEIAVVQGPRIVDFKEVKEEK